MRGCWAIGGATHGAVDRETGRAPGGRRLLSLDQKTSSATELRWPQRRQLRARPRSRRFCTAHAVSNSSDMRLDKFLGASKDAGVAQRLPPDATRGFIDEQLYRDEAANNRRDYNLVQQLLRDVLGPTTSWPWARAGTS